MCYLGSGIGNTFVPIILICQNEGDGDKSDKAESESSKSLHVTGGTSNGCMINYISPSITKRNVTLQMLLAAGILKPGEGTMSLEYHVIRIIYSYLQVQSSFK